MLYALKKEAKQLLQSKTTWGFIAILTILPILVTTDLFGLGSRSFSFSFADTFIYSPAKLSLYLCSAVMCLYTLYSLQKTYGDRNTYTLIESKANPVSLLTRHIFILLLVPIISTVFSFVFILPYSITTIQTIFQFSQFIRIWVYVYLLGLILITLLSASIYLIVRNAEVGFIMVVLIVGLGIPQEKMTSSPYFLHTWFELPRAVFSDGYPGEAMFSAFLYNRIFWLCIAVVLLCISLLCVRRHSTFLLKSIAKNLRMVILPILCVLMIGSSIALSIYQPFFADNKSQLSITDYFDEEGVFM